MPHNPTTVFGARLPTQLTSQLGGFRGFGGFGGLGRSRVNNVLPLMGRSIFGSGFGGGFGSLFGGGLGGFGFPATRTPGGSTVGPQGTQTPGFSPTFNSPKNETPGGTLNPDGSIQTPGFNPVGGGVQTPGGTTITPAGGAQTPGIVPSTVPQQQINPFTGFPLFNPINPFLGTGSNTIQALLQQIYGGGGGPPYGTGGNQPPNDGGGQIPEDPPVTTIDPPPVWPPTPPQPTPTQTYPAGTGGVRPPITGGPPTLASILAQANAFGGSPFALANRGGGFATFTSAAGGNRGTLERLLAEAGLTNIRQSENTGTGELVRVALPRAFR